MPSPISETNSAPAPETPAHRLEVEADAAANLLLRLLEPFVIHHVLPHRLDARVEGDGLALDLAFRAPAPVAERLAARLAVMVGVRAVALAPDDAAEPRAVGRAA